jgi:putative ABC transport system permease protein
MVWALLKTPIPSAWLKRATSLPYLVGGILVLNGNLNGLYWFATAVVVSFVKAVLDAFHSMFATVRTADWVAGSVPLVAGALVLAGALATAQRRRILEAVILKTLGATRRRILISHFLEYFLLAGVTAFFAVALGSAAAFIAVTQLMNIAFTFSAAAVGLALALSMGLVFLFGAVGTWAVLRAPAVPFLRSE